MNCVERIKAICKEQKLPISRLEKELGFANGYFNQLRKGTMPADRLRLIRVQLPSPPPIEKPSEISGNR